MLTPSRDEAATLSVAFRQHRIGSHVRKRGNTPQTW